MKLSCTCTHSIATSWRLPLPITRHLNCHLLVVGCLAGHNIYVISLTLLRKQSLVSIGVLHGPQSQSVGEFGLVSGVCLHRLCFFYSMMLPIIFPPPLVQKQGKNDHFSTHAWFVPFRFTLVYFQDQVLPIFGDISIQHKKVFLPLVKAEAFKAPSKC